MNRSPVLPQVSAFFLADDAWDAHGLAAVTTQYTAEMLTYRFCRHQDNSLDTLNGGLGRCRIPIFR